MAGAIFPDIDPDVTSGTQLASLLNSLKDYIASSGSGAARDGELLQYGVWYDTSTVGVDNLVKMKMYDGATDKIILTYNISTSQVILADASDSFTINKTSDDSVGPVFNLVKKRIAGSGQTLDGDILGQVDFSGQDTLSTEYVQARVRVESTDDVTAAAQGADITISSTGDGTATLVERLRIKGNGLLGLGTIAPDKKLHVESSDDSAEIKVKRNENTTDAPVISTSKKNAAVDNGQVKDLNTIGQFIMKGHDQNGAEVDLMKIESVAGEDITDTAQGNSVTLYHKKTGENTFSSFLSVGEDGTVSIPSLSSTTFQETKDLLDDQATRNLFSVDGTVYGAFVCEALIWGEDDGTGPVNLQSRHKIEGVYDHVNDTWFYEESISTLGGGVGPVVTMNYTNATTFVVDYVNQIAFGDFSSGKIYLDIRRVVR